MLELAYQDQAVSMPNGANEDIELQPLPLDVPVWSKIAYTCRRVPLSTMKMLVRGNIAPRPGGLVVARVEAIGQHKSIANGNGRKTTLFEGDEIVVCYGNRYAPDQFEAEIPSDLSPCHLVAAGGIAARMLSGHAAMDPPTAIAPIGLVGDASGRPVNIAQFGMKPKTIPALLPQTVAVVGTSMNAGKTTSAAYLIRGLVRAGLRVGAAKITGTGAPKDTGLMLDAGASPVFDFTDVGFASTYLASPADVEQILLTVMSHLSADVDAVVLEVADGLFQRETEALLVSRCFREIVGGLVFAANDAMGARAGLDWLRERNLPVLAVSGVVTSSPLAAREAATATGIDILTLSQLSDKSVAGVLGFNDEVRQSA